MVGQHQLQFAPPHICGAAQCVSPMQSEFMVHPQYPFDRQTGPLLQPAVQSVHPKPLVPHVVLYIALLPATHVPLAQHP